MAEERPLFLVDIDRALEGLAIAQSQDLGNFDSLIMHCVDLANALDGARMVELSNFATELSQQLKVHRPTSSQTELDSKNGKELVLLINDLVEIVRSETENVSPGSEGQDGGSNTQDLTQLEIQKKEFWKQLLRFNKQSIAHSLSEVHASLGNVHVAVDSLKYRAIAQNSVVDPIIDYPTSSDIINKRLDQTIQDLDAIFKPFLNPMTSSGDTIASLNAAFNTPVSPTEINDMSSLDKSVATEFIDHHAQYTFQRRTSLNRLQAVRMTAQKAKGWSRSEIDHLLCDQQDDLVRVGQQSLKKRFEGLTDELLIDEVYADPDIAQTLLTCLSILPPCPSIFAVEQGSMVFVDLDAVTPTEDQVVAVGGMLASIAGSIEVMDKGMRISCPSSLIRMPIVNFIRHEELYAIPAVQYISYDTIVQSEKNIWDQLGEIEDPKIQLKLRVGNQSYEIYAHEFIGMQTMNIHLELPHSLSKPAWLGGIALDGASRAHYWVAIDRFTR